MEPLLESPAEEVTRLRECLNDLRGVMAALWTEGEPPRTVSTSLDTLLGIVDELEERFAQRTRELGMAHEALGESERNSRLIIDSIPGLVAFLTPAGEVEFVNRQIVEYTGQSLEELKQWGTNDTVHPEDLPHVIQVFTQSIGSGSPYEIVQRLRRSDGVYRWFQNSGFPLRDAGGHIVRWCVLLTDIDERRRAEEAVRANELNFQLTVDTIPGMVHTMTATGGVEFVNRQILDFFGKTLEELNNWEVLLHPDDRSRVVDLWTRSVATGEPYDAEHRVLRADGTYRWLHSRGLPLRDTSGNIVRWYNLLTDIDERKRAEEALRASEHNLKLIIDTIPALAWSARPDGSAEFLNQSYLDFIGLSADQASDWNWTSAVHPDDLAGLAATWQRLLASEARGEAEARLRRSDGQYRWFLFRANPLRDEKGNVVKWYGVNTDIEDRKRAEQELRRAHEHVTEAQRLSQTGSFIVDVVNDELDWSDEMYRVFEFEPGSKITIEKLRSVIHADDQAWYDDALRQCVAGIDVDSVVRVVTMRGLKYCRTVAHRYEHISDRPVLVGAVQDVTASRLAQEALNSARSELAHVTRVTTLSALTASIAHEVNQPLSGIITNAGTCLRMLAAEPPDVDGARETARRTIRDGNRASDVITRLRALFSKKESTLESLDLNDATREVIALSLSDLQRHRVVLQSDLADDLPVITGDRIQLQQVILNLLRNAADAMVDVNDRPRQLLIRTERDDADHVRVTVRDVGLGLPPQNIDSLFDAFYTTKSGGMGIGLFVSRSIIERHHGRLWAQPNDGPGATFSFSIPFQTT